MLQAYNRSEVTCDHVSAFSVMNMHSFSVLDQKGRFSIPVLDVKSKQLILNTSQTLVLNCR